MSKININDIAKRANVSKMTVSRVLNNSGPVAPKTKENIIQIMKELNYQPNLIARSLSSNKTMTIGVVIPKTEKLFLDNYIAQILSGITDIALENQYRIMLVPVKTIDGDEGCYLNYARSKLFDGLILVKTKTDDKHLNKLAVSEFPFVVVNYRKNNEKINYVDSENINGAEKAVDYLISKGHKKIAIVMGSINETNAKDRLKGYKKSLTKNNIEFNANYIIYGDFNKEKAFTETAKLLTLKNRPTAIFCSDDYMAIGVMEKIREHNLSIPKDIAVIGFDDIELGKYTRPALTTIAQPLYEIGKVSAKVLLEIISKEAKPPVRKILKTELIIRESA